MKKQIKMLGGITLAILVVAAFGYLLVKSRGDDATGMPEPGEGVVIHVPATSGPVLKCPNDYTSAQAYVDAVAQFASDYRTTNPTSSDQDLMGYRAQLMQKNHCAPSKWMVAP